MGSKRITIGVLAFAACFATGAQAHAKHVEQIDLNPFFDADVIVNGTKTAPIDTDQAVMDDHGNALITKGAADALKSCKQDPDGLPNGGKFAKNSDHPAVKLGYSNADDGHNARQMEASDTFEVDVPPGKYRQIHVFATTGEGDSDITVTEVYEGGSELNELTVWDWFVPGGSGYPLIDGMDRARANGSSCFDDDGAIVYGYRINTDKSIRLSSVEVTRTDESGSFLNVLGMTGVRARSH